MIKLEVPEVDGRTYEGARFGIVDLNTNATVGILTISKQGRILGPGWEAPKAWL
jgi:hypothetical protein